MFKGSVVDIQSLMDKLEKSDVTRTQLEDKLADLNEQLRKQAV